MLKGVPGLIIAVVLGIVGAVCNFFYVEKQARNYKSVEFAAVAETVDVGDLFEERHFRPVGIPRSAAGQLMQTAVTWEGRSLYIGQAATKHYDEGEILLQQDLTTRARQDLNEKLGKDEVAIWLPVEARAFNAAQVNPGDRISFLVSTLAPTNGTSDGGGGPMTSGTEQIIGPFRILSLGNRMGRPEPMEAANMPRGPENLIAIGVLAKDGKLEPKARQITQIMQQSNFRGVIPLLLPPEK